MVNSGTECGREKPRVAVAALLGVLVALVTSLIWYAVVATTQYQLGIVAVVVGWLVGKAVVRGAGGVRGPALQKLSAGITAAAMIFSEYLIARHFLAQRLAAEGITYVPVLLPVRFMLLLIGDSLVTDPLTLVFWAIAIWEAYRVPKARLAPAVIGESKPTLP